MLPPETHAEQPVPEPPAEPRAGCLHHGIFALASAWVLGVTFLVETVAWAVGQVLLVQGQPMHGIAWMLVTWVQGVLVLVPTGLLAVLTRPPRLRAAYRTWALSAAFLWVFGLARLIPETRNDAAMLAQGALALGSLAAVSRLARRTGYTRATDLRTAFPGLALSAVLVAPWAALGALGSPLDALLGLAAGLAFGAFASLLLEAFLLAPLAAHPGRDVLFGGFAAGTALAVLGSGFGFGGNQLLLMAALPPLGFALAALARSARTALEGPDRSWLPVAVLTGVTTAAVLVFFDSKELTLLLDEGTAGDVPTWAAAAAGASVLLGWLAALLARLLAATYNAAGRSGAGPLFGAGTAWIALAVVYAVVGQPGFHGDALFVVLRDQADLSAAATMAGRDQRTAYVYRTLANHAADSQFSLRADLDRLRIGYRPYYLVNALEVEGGPIVRLFLSSRPEVDRVLDSPRLRPLPAPQPVSTGEESEPIAPDWNITDIGADRVWRELGVTGRGIVVGQSDSGADGGHPALSGGYRGRQSGDAYNWLDPWNRTPSPTDASGHGTHTLATVLGRDGIGVAPDAEWFACSNLARNLGNPARYLDCMQFMLAPYPPEADPFTDGDPARAAHVTNNSWGCPPLEGCDPTALLPAAAAMRAAGIFMAVSAGNTGPRCGSLQDPPAIYDQVFTVGAVDEAGNVANFSSRGPVSADGSFRAKPDVVAPGEDVLSAYPRSTYERVSGTSMAGPHVAGVVALMWSAQPRLIGDIDRTEEILRATARPYTGRREGCFQGETPSAAFGYGVLDAYAAVRAALEMKD